MSFRLPSNQRSRHDVPSWSGMAVVVEGMVLLLFLVTSLAIITQVFAAATVRGTEGRQLAEAVAAATNEAERFAADPQGDTGAPTTEGDLRLEREVTSQPSASGTLYQATISVFGPDRQEPLYVLTTSRYLAEVD